MASRPTTSVCLLLMSLALMVPIDRASAQAQQGGPQRGGTLVMILNPEPAMLASGLNSSSPVYTVSPKIARAAGGKFVP